MSDYMNGVEAIDLLNDEAWKLMLRAPAEARIRAEDAIERSSRSGYKKGEATALLNLSWCCFYASELDAAEGAAEKALDFFSAMDDLVGVSMSFNALGSVDHERGEYGRALDRYMKAFELASAAGRKDREAASLNNVGEVLRDTGELRDALAYFMRAAEAMKAGRDSSSDAVELEANLFANIGQAFLDLGETGKAAEYLEMALGAAEAAEDVGSEIRAIKGLAAVSRRHGDPNAARDFLDRALRRAIEAGQNLAAVEIRIEKAVLLIEEDDFRSAIEILNKAADAAETAGSKRKLAECLRFRSLSYESLGESAAALSDFKRFHEAEESIFVDRVSQSAKSAEVRFELERARQEAEIYRLRNVELKEHRSELERTNDRLKAVAEIGRVITASLDMDDVTRTVQESLSRLMDATGFCLAVLDPAKDELDFRVMTANRAVVPAMSIPLDSTESYAAWVVSRNETLRIDDADREYSRYVTTNKTVFGLPATSLIYVPLSIGGRVVGAVGVQSPRRSAYDDDDIRLLVALGSFIAVAIENSRTHAEVRRLNAELRSEKEALERLAKRISRIANHDGLTGLPNRLLLGELLEKALSRAERSQKYVAVMFLDLDDFKPINDRFGHISGDRALVEASDRLKNALRASDVVARVGGDEFVAFVVDLDDPEAAAVVAEKLVNSFQTPIQVNGVPCAVGVSIGLSIYPEDGKVPDELLRKADEAMYKVKRTGKNRFSFYNENLIAES